MKRDTAGLIAIIGFVAGAVLGVVSAVLPWAQAPFGVSLSGMDTDDGKMILVVAILLGVIAFAKGILPTRRASKWGTLIVAAILGALFVITAIYDMAGDQGVVGSTHGVAHVGSGLVVALLAGILTCLAVLAGIFEDTSVRMASPLSTSSHALPSPVPHNEPTNQSPDSPVARENMVQRLRELKQLHSEGILTDDEYERKRQNLVEEL